MPKAYRDELLNSIIARFTNMNYGGQHWIAKDILFGNRYADSSPIIPKSISNFSHLGLNYYQYVIENTQYCFYTAFLSKDALERVNSHINDGNTGGNPFASIAHIQPLKTLRFCPICASEEYRRYGEMYWHRIHQTPGVFCCERHRILLFETAIRNDFRQKAYKAAEFEIIFPIKQFICNQKTLPFLMQLTQDIRYIYENYEGIREIVVKESESFRLAYMDLCIRHGFATAAGSLHISKLKKHFLGAVPEELLKETGLSFSDSEKKPWIIRMCRSGSLATDPLKHLLFSEFLCGSFQLFINKHLLMDHDRETKKRKKREIPKDKIERYREQWLKACENNGSDYMSEVQKIVPSVYLWLSRNDNAWLHQNSSHKKKGSISASHNWERLDGEYAQKIQSIAIELKKETNPTVHVTKTLLMKNIGRSPKKIYDSTLPETMREIEIYSESNQEYRMRKVRNAVSECIKLGQKPTKWKIIKKASISDKYAEACWGQIQRELDDESTVYRESI